MSDDDYVQYGIVAAVHFSLCLGNAVSVALQTITSSFYVPAPINKAAISDYRYGEPWNINFSSKWYLLGQEGQNINSKSVCATIPVSTYKEDLTNVKNAIDNIDDPVTGRNYIKDQFTAYLKDVLHQSQDVTLDPTLISSMTTAGLKAYLDYLATP
jgi:hypothetical protein